MSTKQGTIDYILDQLVSLKNVSARKMFGGYALYCDGKVVGLICNDTLYIKITKEGKEFVDKYYKEGYAYDGAKVSMQINEDQIDNREWLSKLVSITAENLPIPKPKKFKNTKVESMK
jgi:DNA transformation protein